MANRLIVTTTTIHLLMSMRGIGLPSISETEAHVSKVSGKLGNPCLKNSDDKAAAEKISCFHLLSTKIPSISFHLIYLFIYLFFASLGGSWRARNTRNTRTTSKNIFYIITTGN